MSEREFFPQPEDQPDQPLPYHINVDRPNTEWEEIDNNAYATREALLELVQARVYEEHYGKPMTHMFDDLDRGAVVSVPMDQERRAMVLTGIAFEQDRLRKSGIVFDRDDQV